MIPLISAHYTKNDWTRFEFESARREEEQSGREFILPVRIDDSRMLGLLDDRIYLSLTDQSIDEIANAFSEKMAMSANRRGERSAKRNEPTAATILDRATRQALGLIATAEMPLTIDHYKRLFAEIDWTVKSRTLLQKRLVTMRGRLLYADKDAAATILSDDEEHNELEAVWIATLEPLRYYKDMAPCLAIHYIKAGRFEDAAALLTEVASAVDLGPWNSLYFAALTQLADRRLEKELDPKTRLSVQNALGLTLSRARRYDDALMWLGKSRANAKRLGDDCWLGQAYINTGFVCFQSGDRQAAFRWYEKARHHGYQTDDLVLAGRALGNLAEMTREICPTTAKELLRESIGAKKQAGDHEGLVAATIQLGNLEAAAGEPAQAIQHYEKALRLCAEFDDPYAEAMTLHNLGNAQRECGRRAIAIPCYKRAYSLASELEYADVQILASLGLGAVCFELGRFTDAETAFQQFLAFAESTGDGEHRLCALHGLGVIQLTLGQVSKGRNTLGRALRLARETDSTHWAVRCIVDGTREVEDRKLSPPDVRLITRTARAEQRKGNPGLAAELWRSVAHARMQSQAEQSLIDDAFQHAYGCLEEVRDKQANMLGLLLELSEWLWQSRRFDESLALLKQAEKTASSSGLVRDRLQCLDQRGVCLQELGRLEEAIPIHRKAAGLAEKHRDLFMLETCLNNLGEGLRKLGQFEKAQQTLSSAESVAVRRGDHESAISIAHNRALALQQQGDEVAAAKLFIECRDRSSRRGFWGEYVRAWEALANLACYQTRRTLAKTRYKRALREARKHKLHDMLPRIALNYARFLEWLGEPKLALRELAKHEQGFRNELDAHLYHFTLGQLHQNLGNLDAAVKQFTTGRELAQTLGDVASVADCSAHLAGVYEAQDQVGLSLSEMRNALGYAHEPEQQAELLIQLLRIQLAAGDDKASEGTFEKARSLADEHGLHHDYVDLHMTLAEHEWKGDRASKLNAMKAWAVAILRALEVDVSEPRPDTGDSSFCGEIAGHVARTLTTPQLAAMERQFDSLMAEVEDWLANEVGNSQWLVRSATWPFKMARRLLPYIESPQRLADEVDRLLADKEFVASVR